MDWKLLRFVLSNWILVSAQCCSIGNDVATLLKYKPLDLGSPALVVPTNSSQRQKQCWISEYKELIHQIGFSLYLTNWKTLATVKKDSTSPVFSTRATNGLQEVLDLIAKKNLGTGGRAVVIAQEQSLSEMKSVSVKIRVNQNVLVIHSQTYQMFEVYQVNDITIWKRVGQIVESSFVFDPTWTLDRINLQGVHLKALTAHSPPHVKMDPDYKSKAPFDEMFQMYDVTQLAPGFYHDILLELSRSMNFTFTLYKRNDDIWGTIINGKPAGILESLADGSVDLVAAGYGMNFIRQPYCKHLPILTPYYPAVAIKKNLKEEFIFTTFTSPYNYQLWLAMALVAFIFSGWLFLANDAVSENKAFDKFITFLGWLWISVSAFVGGPPNEAKMAKNSSSNKIVLFTCLLGGTVLWMGYQATLTSILAVIKVTYPFDSLETLYKTDFKLGTFLSGSTQADLFAKAQPGTVHHALFHDRMQNNQSFVPTKVGLQLMMEEDKYAYTNYYADLLAVSHPDYDCKITVVWKSRIPALYGSFATPKNSIYYKVFAWQLLKMKVTGQISAHKNKHYKGEPNCEPLVKEAAPLGIRKLIMLFVIVGAGTLLGCVMVTFEIVLSKTNQHGKDLEPEIDFFDDPEVIQALRVIQSKVGLSKDSNGIRRRKLRALISQHFSK